MEIFKIQIFLTFKLKNKKEKEKKKKRLVRSEVHCLTFSIILPFLFYFFGLFGLNMATQIPAKQEADLGVIHETCTSI